jgi:histidinol-phosphate aminotransferase
LSDGGRFFRRSTADLVPYEPGKPVEEVQRELGLDRVVKLASNEGPFPPFPAAVEALERCAHELNRYPDGGAWELRAALAAHHGVGFDQVAIGAGADGVIDCLSQAALDEGDEIVCGWPSFPSYVLDAIKVGATPIRIPLREHRYDLDALLEAITPRTKLVYVCHPNNPTGTINTRAELDRFLDQVPGHVLPVVDQAYFEYIDDPDYPDAIEEYFKKGARVVVLRTFSKIYGLAGLRVGYGIAAEDVVAEIGKVRRAFDVSTAAQVAAVASLGDEAELARRRGECARERGRVVELLTGVGFDVAGPAVANFVYAETGSDARAVFDALLREGVIVRPLHGFGSETAIRVTIGTADENDFLAAALEKVTAATTN